MSDAPAEAFTFCAGGPISVLLEIEPWVPPRRTTGPRSLYLDLVERCLLGAVHGDPAAAHTMVGARRLNNLRVLCEDVISRGVSGDMIETGVWRGGACVMMRAVLKAHDSHRVVWCADSFAGLPAPDAEKYPADAGDRHFERAELAVSAEEVRRNFARYDLLDAQVRFLEGWFKDTLPSAPIDRLSILRLDGDMYESTIQALEALYDKLSPGGYVIVDDFGAVAGCRAAVCDFRAARGISDTIYLVDDTGVFWRKS